MSSTALIAKSSFLVSRIMSSRSPSPKVGFDCHEFRARPGSGQAALTPVDPKPSSRPPSLVANAGTTTNSGRATRVKDQLRDAVAGLDPYTVTLRIAVPCRNQARALVIGVDHPDCVAQHQPFSMAET